MQVKALHEGHIMPTKGSTDAGAYDLYMPDDGSTGGVVPSMVGLGFSAAVPEGYVALILPRSSTGAKFGLELNNTCGVIDADYRGEWMVAIRTKNGMPFSWVAGERLFQFLLVPVLSPTLELVTELPPTKRGNGGFGSSGL